MTDSLLHKLDTIALGQSQPWSHTIVCGTSWQATCSCGRWRLATWDRETIQERWEQHVVEEGGL